MIDCTDMATPTHKMNYTDGCNRFYIKRDDLFPLSFGGNKARKAVLFFRDIMEKGSDCVVTYGSRSSNHCRVTANMAACLNLKCHIITPDDSDYQTANSRLTELLGAEITTCPLSQTGRVINEKMEELTGKGYKPYFIQGGGHGNIGTRAYVKAYQEIAAYENEQGLCFDYIFLASGTGTTQAGLICGKTVNGAAETIVGISIARINPYGCEVVMRSVSEYLLSTGIDFLNKNISLNEVVFIDEYILSGYGSHNDCILETIKTVLASDGIPLDAIYTGKAFYGMKKYIETQKIKGKNILFLHTGGTPLFFDTLELLGNGGCK